MENVLKQLVSQDTPKEWQKIKNDMPWNFTGAGEQVLKALVFESVEIDTDDESKIKELIDQSPKGTIWGEFYLDPFIMIGKDFYPYIENCQQMIKLDGVPSLSNLTGIYRSDSSWNSTMPEAFVSYLVIACPRCQLLFTKGDEDFEFDPIEEDNWIQDSCPACDGTGEWMYEFLI